MAQVIQEQGARLDREADGVDATGARFNPITSSRRGREARVGRRRARR